MDKLIRVIFPTAAISAGIAMAVLSIKTTLGYYNVTAEGTVLAVCMALLLGCTIYRLVNDDEME